MAPNTALSSAKPTNTHSAGSSLCRPASTTHAQPVMETAKPASPSAIIGLRPTRSDRRAQSGAVTVHRSAEREKMPAISGSGMPMARPIGGSTDCRPRLPA